MAKTLEFIPGELKAWFIRNASGDWLCLSDFDAVISEVESIAENDDIEWDHGRVTKYLKVMKPGESRLRLGENWSVVCEMVSQEWFDKLPEHDGW